VGDDDRVVVDVDDVGAGADLVGDLVHGALGGEADADVEELGDAGGFFVTCVALVGG
jgi:hypothetical protein